MGIELWTVASRVVKLKELWTVASRVVKLNAFLIVEFFKCLSVGML